MDISIIVGIFLACVFVVPFVWMSIRNSKNTEDKEINDSNSDK